MKGKITTRLIVLAVVLSFVVVLSANTNAQTVYVLFYLGVSPSMPPADSLTFRQALAYGLDREAIVKAVTPHRTQTPQVALGINHPKLPGYNPEVRGYSYDPAKAKEFYSQAGWTGSVTILASAPRNKFMEALYLAIENSLTKTLGTTVRLQPVANFDVLVNAARAGSIPVYVMGWRSDPADFGYPSFALGLANSFISDPEVKTLVERGDSNAVEQILLEKALIIPIFHF
jgi:peptide/nickel transport system substrate-binding protein/oligopeptide transport system substrate-binding protein